MARAQLVLVAFRNEFFDRDPCRAIALPAEVSWLPHPALRRGPLPLADCFLGLIGSVQGLDSLRVSASVRGPLLSETRVRTSCATATRMVKRETMGPAISEQR